MKTNIKQLSLILLLTLGYSSSNYSMASDAYDADLEARSFSHQDRIAQKAIDEQRGMTQEEYERSRRLQNIHTRREAVEEEDRRMQAQSTTTTGMPTEGGLEMVEAPEGAETGGGSFEQRNPRTAAALRRVPFKSVRDALMKRAGMQAEVDPSDVPSATDEKATTALRQVVITAEEEGVDNRSLWDRIKDTFVGKAVGEARQALSDWVDEKRYQFRHRGETDFNDTRRALKSKFDEQKDLLKQDKKDALAARKGEQQVQIDRMNADFKESMNKMKAEHAAARRGIKGDDLKTLKAEQDADLKREEEGHKRSVSLTRAQHQADLQDLGKEFDNRMQGHADEYQSQRDRLNASIKRRVQRGSELDGRIAERNKQYTDEVSHNEKQRKTTMDARKARQKTEVEEQKAQHEKELDAHKAKYKGKRPTNAQEDDLNAMLDRHKQERRDKFDTHQQELDKVDADYDTGNANAAARRDADIDSMKSSSAQIAQYREARLRRRVMGTSTVAF